MLSCPASVRVRSLSRNGLTLYENISDRQPSILRELAHNLPDHFTFSKLENDFSEMLSFPHVADCGSGMRPGKYPIDHRMHVIRLDRAVHRLERFSRSDRNAAHRGAMIEDFEWIDRALLTADIADHIDLAADANRLQRLQEAFGSPDLDHM